MKIFKKFVAFLKRLRKPVNTPRSFWQYNVKNWPIFIPFAMGIGGGFLSLTDGVLGMALFFFAVSLTCVVGSLIDWWRLG